MVYSITLLSGESAVPQGGTTIAAQIFCHVLVPLTKSLTRLYCSSLLPVLQCSSVPDFMASCFRLPCRVQATCNSEPLCSYYCSYSPGKKSQWIKQMVISDAEPNVGKRWRGRGRLTERKREYLSLQKLQYRDRTRILIIMRKEKKKLPLRERTRWVLGFGGF